VREVTEIGQAVMRLGLDSVRASVISLSAASAFKTDEPAHKAFYQSRRSSSTRSSAITIRC